MRRRRRGPTDLTRSIPLSGGGGGTLSAAGGLKQQQEEILGPAAQQRVAEERTGDEEALRTWAAEQRSCRRRERAAPPTYRPEGRGSKARHRTRTFEWWLCIGVVRPEQNEGHVHGRNSNALLRAFHNSRGSPTKSALLSFTKQSDCTCRRALDNSGLRIVSRKGTYQGRSSKTLWNHSQPSTGTCPT